MPSVYDLKPKFQALLRPLTGRAVQLGLTPNVITLSALGGSALVGILLLQARPFPLRLLLLPVWLFVRMALNAMDGMMAREHNLKTSIGAVLNELGDVFSDLFLYLPLAAADASSCWPIVAFNLGAVLTEFSGVLGQALGARRHYEGPMGKSDRAFVIGALGLITYCWPGGWMIWPWAFSVLAGLTVVTCGNRVVKALAELPR